MHLKNIVRAELIGKTVKVHDAKNPSIKDMEGKIVDETKHTLKIQTKNGTKTIMKNQVVLDIKHDKHTIRIQGEKITGRSEERIKKKVK